MNWQAAFAQVFDDKDWLKKLLIGAILTLIPIVNIIPIGYALKVLKNVAEGQEQPFRTWDDLGDYFVRGLTSLIGILIWSLPIIAIAMLTGILSMWSGYDYAEASRTSMPLAVCMWSLTCVSGLYSLILAVFLPAAITWYAVKGQLGAMFRVGEIMRFISRNLGIYVVALFLSVAAAFLAQIGLVLCCIGVVVTEFWASLVASHLFGQVYRSGSTQTSSETPAS